MFKVSYKRIPIDCSKYNNQYGDKKDFGAIEIYRDGETKLFVGEIVNENYSIIEDEYDTFYRTDNHDRIGNYGTIYKYNGYYEGKRCLEKEAEILKEHRIIYYPNTTNEDKERMSTLGFNLLIEPDEITIGYETYYILCGKLKYHGYYVDNEICYEAGEEYYINGYHGYGKLYSNISTVSPNNLVYEGEWYSNKRNGFGKSYYENGVLCYEGQWENDNKHGYGKYYNSNGILLYEGEWRLGYKHGYGKLYDKNSECIIYEGNFYSGSYDGEGIEYYDRNKYDVAIIKFKGRFNDGKYDYGIIYDKEGNKVYNGGFIDGMKGGFGHSYYENNKLEYEGNWLMDSKHGQGKLYNKNNSLLLYEGFFSKNNILAGKLYYNDITVMQQIKFEGQFNNNEPKSGIIYNRSGYKIYEGQISKLKNFNLEKYNGIEDV